MACTFLDCLESCYYSSQPCFDAVHNKARDCEHCSYKPEEKSLSLSQEILDLSEDNKFWEDEEKAEQEFIKSQEEAYFNHN